MPGLNIGIDLGTDTVTFFVEGKGIVLSESTAICYDAYDDSVIAVGNASGGKRPKGNWPVARA